MDILILIEQAKAIMLMIQKTTGLHVAKYLLHECVMSTWRRVPKTGRSIY
jgi:hypothetical protein